MMNEKRQEYLAPFVGIVNLENEGVMALSATLPEVEDGGDAFEYDVV